MIQVVYVSLSDDGTIVTVLISMMDHPVRELDDNRGHVRIYKYKVPSSDEWTFNGMVNGGVSEQAASQILLDSIRK